MVSLILSAHKRSKHIESKHYKTEMTGGIYRHYSAGDAIFEEDSDTSRMLFLVGGWAVCSKMLPNGTRIVVDFALRGDMLFRTSTEMAQESVQALSDVTVYELPDFSFSDVGRTSPKLYGIILKELMRRQARMGERLANIGRRDALERTGHLLLELATRVGAPISRPDFDGFECPLTQSDMGDAVGLSTVHINRVLKDMRLNGLLSFRNGIVEFFDRRRLVAIVDFDPSYFTQQSL
jgi:CRP-like cAMP-binding protein